VKLSVLFEEDKVTVGSRFILNIIKRALEQKPSTPTELRKILYTIAGQNGILHGNKIQLPKDIDPDGKFYLVVYPESADGKTNAEAHGSAIRLYADVILKDPKRAIPNINGIITHELAHIFEKEGTSPDEDVIDAGERTVKYLSDSGEINSNARQIATLYNHVFPGQPLDDAKLNELAQQYKDNETMQCYLIKFRSKDIQSKYAHIADLEQVYQDIIDKIQKHLT
jgi:hypothetical protein